jgi:hypothetical protein
MKNGLIIFLLLMALCTNAQDALQISLNKQQFNIGDTINIDCAFKYNTKDKAAVTLHVWIEEITKQKIWKYRYPLVNGNAAFDLVIGNNLPAGKYALNFLVQQAFFSFKGKIRDYSSKTKMLTMMMLTKGKDSYIDNIPVAADGTFKLPKLQFADTARVIFSPVGKKQNDLFIDAETILDSAFTPLTQQTLFITVGNPSYNYADTVKSYNLDAKRFEGTFTLNEVIVKSTAKKQVEKYDEEYVSPLFKGGRVFDGLEDNLLASSTDIFQFLRGRVPGLNIQFDETGNYKVTRRNLKVDIYLDEFRLDASEQAFIIPQDIAMIKVFDPLEGPGTAPGGTIAIYSKRGNYIPANSRKYSFFIRGFSPFTTTWQ